MLNHKKQLLLLSYEYPFGNSETFLENELYVLSREFSRITILPTRAFFSPSWFSSNKSNLRKLPTNCYLNRPLKQTGFKVPVLVCLILFWRGIHSGLPFRGFFYAIKELMRSVVKTSCLIKPINKHLRQCDTNSLVAYSYWKGDATVALCYTKQQGRLRACATRCHGGDLYDNVLPFPYRPFEKYIARECDLVMPVSQSGVKYLTEKGFPQTRLRIARLGVKRMKTVARFSSDGMLRVVSCSNLIPLKRIPMLCKALSMLNHPFSWTHFGDGEERSILERLITDLPKHGTANLFGRIPNHEILSYYQNNPVDIFVNVSSSEGVPVSVMEAMIAGIPCIATNVGGTSELINNDCGYLLPADIDSTELASILETIITSPIAWQQKRTSSFLRACQLCDAKKNYHEFSELLQNMLRTGTQA